MNSCVFDLTDRVALVTGAAQGIGRVVACELARAGAGIVVADLAEEPGQQAVDEIVAMGGQAVFVKGDLRSKADVECIVAAGPERLGRLDIVVNNARPRLRPQPFAQSMEQWDLAMDVLLKGPALVAKCALPHLLESPGGQIINISSTNASFVSQQAPAYHVAKAGLEQLTRCLACEFGPQGIRVNAICPGLVDLLDRETALTADPVNKAVVESVVPLRRAGVAEDTAGLILFLCTDAATYITGQCLTVDGGITLSDHFMVARKTYLDGRGAGADIHPQRASK